MLEIKGLAERSENGGGVGSGELGANGSAGHAAVGACVNPNSFHMSGLVGLAFPHGVRDKPRIC